MRPQHINKFRDGKAFSHFLYSRVNRPWNTVYHEICQMADIRSDQGYELRRRIKWNVEMDVFMDSNGVAYEKKAYGGRAIRVRGLFVHPTTGILLESRKEVTKKRVVPPTSLEWLKNVFLSVRTLTVRQSADAYILSSAKNIAATRVNITGIRKR
jgi:hypothetical protein